MFHNFLLTSLKKSLAIYFFRLNSKQEIALNKNGRGAERRKSKGAGSVQLFILSYSGENTDEQQKYKTVLSTDYTYKFSRENFIKKYVLLGINSEVSILWVWGEGLKHYDFLQFYKWF